MKDKNNSYEIDLCWLRIQAISKGREIIAEELHHKYPSYETDAKDDLRLAYIEFNNSFDDLLKAEMKYLNSLKEITENEQKKPAAIKVSDVDLEYLGKRVEKKLKESKCMHLQGAIFMQQNTLFKSLQRIKNKVTPDSWRAAIKIYGDERN